MAPRPSVRSGRPDFIILTPPRNSSHPSFFFFFSLSSARPSVSAATPEWRRPSRGATPSPPPSTLGVRVGEGRRNLWTAEPLPLPLRRTDDTRPTWIAELVAQTNVNFFLPHLFYCHFGSDKKMPPTNCLENRVALYMFGLNYSVVSLFFFVSRGKKKII